MQQETWNSSFSSIFLPWLLYRAGRHKPICWCGDDFLPGDSIFLSLCRGEWADGCTVIKSSSAWKQKCDLLAAISCPVFYLHLFLNSHHSAWHSWSKKWHLSPFVPQWRKWHTSQEILPAHTHLYSIHSPVKTQPAGSWAAEVVQCRSQHSRTDSCRWANKKNREEEACSLQASSWLTSGQTLGGVFFFFPHRQLGKQQLGKLSKYLAQNLCLKVPAVNRHPFPFSTNYTMRKLAKHALTTATTITVLGFVW